MSNLLTANFARLWKSKLLWAAMVVMASLAVLLCFDHYYYYRMGMYDMNLDSIIWGYACPVGILAASFASMFLGTEYSNGTIRNKMIAGHTREEIYLANLITVFVASLLMSLAYVAMICVLGIPFFGGLKSPWEAVLVYFLISVITIASFAAIFTMFTMLSRNKAMSVYVCLILAFALLIMTVWLNSRLDEPEFWGNDLMTVWTEDGECDTVVTKWNPNPYYVKGAKREVYQFLNDSIPFGQGIQIGNMFNQNPEHIGRMPLCSLAIVMVTTGAGLYTFRRKDLK